MVEVRRRTMYPFCSVDQVEQSQQCDRDSHSWSVHHGNQRLREVDVGLHILPVQRRRETTEEENEQSQSVKNTGSSRTLRSPQLPLDSALVSRTDLKAELYDRQGAEPEGKAVD